MYNEQTSLLERRRVAGVADRCRRSGRSSRASWSWPWEPYPSLPPSPSRKCRRQKHFAASEETLLVCSFAIPQSPEITVVSYLYGAETFSLLDPRLQSNHYLTVDVPITLIHISLRPWPLIPPYRSPSSLTSLRRLRISSWSLPLFLKLAIRAPEPALGGSDILTRTERSPRHSADPRRSYEYSISNVTAWTEYAVRRITQSALDSAQRRSATWFHTDGDDGYMLKDRGRRSGDKGFSNEALTRFSLK